jgi:FKBP-type peptidyl-prolyl cis-trans isomerase FklB
MKTLFFLLSILISINLSAQMDTTSYSVGMILAKNLMTQGVEELDMDAVTKGMADMMAKKETAVTMEQATSNFQTLMREAQGNAHKDNRVKGEKFLAENGKRAEVKTTASGLQYEVITASDSTQKPSLSDKVNVHYHGTLIDGTVFDSSVERGEPISFPLNGVIQGWQEGLQLMTVGSKYRLYIPYNLAYGERAAGPTIAPFSALIFDVTLLEIQ